MKCHQVRKSVLATILFVLTLLGSGRLDAVSLPDSQTIDDKLQSCPDGLVNDLRNATVQCSQSATPTGSSSEEEQPEVEEPEPASPLHAATTAGVTRTSLDGSRAAWGALKDSGRDLLSMARRRREAHVPVAVLSTVPTTEALEHDPNSAEIHSPIVLCAVERLRVLHPILDAILDHCNASVVAANPLGGAANISISATHVEAQHQERAEPGGPPSHPHSHLHFHPHPDPRHLHVHEQVLHMMHLATCLDDKLRLACPTLDFAAHIHSL